MAIALAAFRKAFLRRHLTKYEDSAIDDYLKGEITYEEFKERLRVLEYSEDMVEIIASFYKDRQLRATRRATLAIISRRFWAGMIDEATLRAELLRLGYKAEHIDYVVEDIKSRTPEPPELTKAECLRVFREGLRPESWIRERLMRRGYTGEDLELLIELNRPKES